MLHCVIFRKRTTETALVVIGLLAAGQGVLLALLLASKRTNHSANRILAVLIASFAIAILNAVFIISGSYHSFPHLVGVIYPFPLLYGPLWYLYARSLSSHVHPWRTKDFLHFVPALLMYAFLFPYLMEGAEWKARLMDDPATRMPPEFMFTDFLMILHGLIYLMITVRLLRRHLKRLRDFFSDIDNINLQWLRTITFVLGSIWILLAMLNIARLAGVTQFMSLSPIVAATVSVFVFTAGYLGLRQREIFEPRKPAPQKGTSDIESQAGDDIPGRYRKSGLSEEKKAELRRKLLQALNQEKLYINSSLTLTDLAETLGVSEHNLSEVINTLMHQTFYDLVNSYRVREVQQRLADSSNRHFTLLAIAFDSGFNSKSTFNTIFKKHTGLTPKEYRRTLK